MAWTSLLNWAQEILAMAVLFTLASLLLPEGSMRGTVRAVMGVAFLAALIGPLVGLMEDGELWSQTAARWLAAAELDAAEPVPPAGSLVREGLHEAMSERAVELTAASTEAAAWRALEGAGYEPLEVRLSTADGGAPRLEVRARRRALAGVDADRLAAYVAALAGLEGPQAVQIELEP